MHTDENGKRAMERNRHAHQQWYSRGYVPHFSGEGLVQHVTFHLADSLPRAAVERMQREITALPPSAHAVERRERIHNLLDSGLGACVLRETGCARIVEDALLYADGDRYRLLAWVVMPNHVHVLVEQRPGWPLAKVVQSWKRHTSREIHRLESEPPRSTQLPLNRPALWQRDYWDRFVRDDMHLRTVEDYIEHNPVQAGLVATPEDWAWGSARLKSR